MAQQLLCQYTVGVLVWLDVPSSSACGPEGAVGKTEVTRKVESARRRGVSGTALATALATTMAMVGCGGDRSQGAMTADLERDLQMAVTAKRPLTQVVSAIEGGPPNGPSGDQRGRREAIPVPRKAPKPVPQAQLQETAALPQLDMTNAPSVEVTERMEAAPTAVPEPSIEAPSHDIGVASGGPSAGSGGDGNGRRGSGWGTAIGTIIRGGAAGIDNCEAHDRRGGRRMPGTIGGTPVYAPPMGGVIGGMIGGAVANAGGIRRAVPRR